MRALVERPYPNTVREVRSFIQAASFFRRFIKGFAEVAKPLNSRIAPDAPPSQLVLLDESQRDAIDRLRSALTTAPLLRPFDNARPVVVDTDASQYAIGAVLLQPHETGDPARPSTLHPCAYYSRMLSETQQRYPAQERELLAIVLALQHWRTWIEGLKIVVRTDHASLAGVRTKLDPPPRVHRFLDYVEHYDPEIVYRKGPFNVVADHLSRPPPLQVLPVNASPSPPTPEPLTPPSSPQPRVQPATAQQPQTPAPQAAHSNPERPPSPPLTWQQVQNIREFLTGEQELEISKPERWAYANFSIEDGELHFKRGKQLVRVADAGELRAQAVQLHEALGHGTIGAIQRLLAKQLWNPDELLLIQEVVRRCPRCVLRRPYTVAKDLYEPLAPAQAMQRWGLDYCQVPLPSDAGFRYMLNAVDYATSWAYSVSQTRQTSEHVVELLGIIILAHGAPAEIVTDNGTPFTAAATQQILTLYGITRREIVPYRPQANGKVERFNQSILRILRGLAEDHPRTSWENLLPRALEVYRATPMLSGHTPYYLAYGTPPPRDPVGRPSEVLTTYTREPTPEDDRRAYFARALEVDLAGTEREAVNSSRYARDATRSFLQRDKALLGQFAPGDWVLRRRRAKHKFDARYDGPHRVVAAHPDSTYDLESANGMPIGRLHGERLYPAHVYDGHPVDSPWYDNPNCWPKTKSASRPAPASRPHRGRRRPRLVEFAMGRLLSVEVIWCYGQRP